MLLGTGPALAADRHGATRSRPGKKKKRWRRHSSAAARAATQPEPGMERHGPAGSPDPSGGGAGCRGAGGRRHAASSSPTAALRQPPPRARQQLGVSRRLCLGCARGRAPPMTLARSSGQRSPTLNRWPTAPTRRRPSRAASPCAVCACPDAALLCCPLPSSTPGCAPKESAPKLGPKIQFREIAPKFNSGPQTRGRRAALQAARPR